MSRIRGMCLCRLVLVVVSPILALSGKPARSITIDLTFPAGATNPNDPTGAGLQALAQEAATRWEDIIEDSFTMKLNVSYYLNDGFGNGPCGTNVQTACAPLVSDNAAENRTVEGNLLVFANRNWYIDPTPSTDTEFNFTQTQYLDLSPAAQTAGYSGSFIEPLLEVGFRGADNATDPNVSGNFDMLSTLLHEIGHHLGVTNQFQAAIDETADDDYDLPSSLLGGRNMAVEAAPGAEFHMVDSFPLMSNVGANTGVRRLPAAADVLSMAAVSNWTQIDLSRQDFLLGTNWGTASNWIGNQVPGAADAAFIRGGYNDLIGTGDIHLDQNDSVASLFVGTSSNFHTNAFRMDVSGTTTIEFGGVFPFSQIYVETGGELETGNLDIAGGELDMEGGLADIQSTLTITKESSGGNLTGFGTVDVQTMLINNGLINATDDGTLTFTTTNSGNVFDIDGSGNGEVRATSGNIVFAGNIHPVFAGEMSIGEDHFIEINNPWRLTPAGELNIQGGTTAATAAELRGADLEVEGTINIDKRADFNLSMSFDPTADVNLPDVDDWLELGDNDDTITYNGGTFSGNGRLVQVGDAVVSAGATVNINVGVYDWDIGAGADLTNTTLETGAQMIIDVGSLADTHDGNVTLNSNSMLSVTTSAGSWDYDGVMTFNPTGFGTSIVNGSTLNVTANGLLYFQGGTGVINPQVGMVGDMLVEGIADFNSTVGFGSASVTTLNGGILRFNGPFTNYSGSTITGTGTIQQNGNGSIVDSQTITLNGIFDWDGASNNSQFFVNPGKAFNLTATSINTGSDTYNGQLNLLAGTIAVDVASDLWTMAGTLRMTGAIGQGAAIFGDPVDITGDVETVVGEAHFFATTSRFLAGSATDVAAGTELQFNAPVTWSGGTHSGAGLIGVNDSGLVNGGAIDIEDLEIGGSATMIVSGGSVTAANFHKQSTTVFDFNGGSFTVDGGVGTFNASLVYSGPSAANQPTFNVENGADVSVTFAWRVGESSGEFGTTNVNGTGAGNRSTLRGTGGGGGADLMVGRFGNGVLNVTGGALVDFGDDFIIGDSVGGNGLATISGIDGANRSEVVVTRAGANAVLNVGRLGTGELRVENGGRLVVGGDGTVGNAVGAVGTMLIGGSAGGMDATVDIGGDFAVGGTLGTPGGAGHVTVNADGRLDANEIRIWPDGRIDINDGQVAAAGNVTVDGGVLNVASGAAAMILGSGASLFTQNGGTVAGSGSIALPGTELVNQAFVAPGTSTGELSIKGGTYRQQPKGALQIEIGGSRAGEFDVLSISGSAILDGILDVELLHGFMPRVGNSFEILFASSAVSGVFSTLPTELPLLPGGMNWNIAYSRNNVVLEVLAGLPGDFDNDGDVDGRDFLVWQRNTSVGNLADWQANYGAGSLAASIAVPEPSACLLLMLALVAIRVRVYRRRHNM